MPVAALDLEPALQAAFGRRIAAVERRPFAYATSHPLEEVDVVLEDGRVVELVLKDGDALAHGALDAKPAFLVDPEREATVYRELLGPAGAEAPRVYASGRTWLLLERVASPPLTEVGEFAWWERAVQRLAALHELLQGRECAPLVRYDEPFFRRWLGRARRLTGGLDAIEVAHAAAVECMRTSPRTVIHGELYASNVLAAEDRIWVLDWETAGLGPALFDLAAFTSGGWDDGARTALALAYRSAMSDPPAVAAFLHDLDCARLLLAVQWLGWSEGWTPPPWQQQDWLAEAERAAERIA